MTKVIRMITGMSLAIGALVSSASAEQVQPCCASGDNGKPHATTLALTDLGKSSPSAVNYSRSPDYQVFLFSRDAHTYIEVTDLAGAPRAAFAVINGGVLALPVGSDAVHQVAVAAPVSDVVYEDASTVVGFAVGENGSTTWQLYVK